MTPPSPLWDSAESPTVKRLLAGTVPLLGPPRLWNSESNLYGFRYNNSNRWTHPQTVFQTLVPKQSNKKSSFALQVRPLDLCTHYPAALREIAEHRRVKIRCMETDKQPVVLLGFWSSVAQGLILSL